MVGEGEGIRDGVGDGAGGGVGDGEGDDWVLPSASPAGLGHVVSFRLSGQNSLILSCRYH